MLNFAKGCYVPKAEQINEQYDIGPDRLTANVGTEKIGEVFRHFIRMQDAGIFFVLELPSNGKDEAKLRAGNKSPFHVDVYYIDGLDGSGAQRLLDMYGELLINDGMSRFGFGCHDNSAELMLDKYNVMLLWTKEAKKYTGFFEAHGIPQAEKCVTAWMTFTRENPGQSKAVETDGLSVYDLPEKLRDWGIYLAEQREDS